LKLRLKEVDLFSVLWISKSTGMCAVGFSSEQDAVMAEQLQSAEMVGRENERLQTELKDAVSSF